MKLINQILILLVGGLFIFSGMIKVNDPTGTAIKLQEYFEVFATDFGAFFHSFTPFAMPLAVLITILEVVLGVALIVNFRRRNVLLALLAMIVFFTFLTFYSAYFNKVTDCGCFGDAIKLTPWQSFSKDIVLLLAIGWLFFQKNTFENTMSKSAWIGTSNGIAIATVVAYMGLNHLPIIDFLPYKKGESISENMKMRGKPDIVYTFAKDGKEMESREWLKPEDGYKYVSAKTANENEIKPKITDFQVADLDGNDMTTMALTGNKLWVIIEKTKEADKEVIKAINQLADGLVKDSVQAFVLTADQLNFEEFRHEVQLALPYYSTDATVLKAMIRANPGILLLQNGVVKGKWHSNDVPSADEARKLLF